MDTTYRNPFKELSGREAISIISLLEKKIQVERVNLNTNAKITIASSPQLKGSKQ